jgi:prepilin-type N-terminal cleavage/methylation domain-containing protein
MLGGITFTGKIAREMRDCHRPLVPLSFTKFLINADSIHMKTRPVARRAASGFTLVELLVVISIIVVLAAMSFGAANMAMTKAKKLQTSNDARALKQAIQAFNSEYSRLPDFGAQGDEAQTDGEAGAELLTILLGKEEVSDSMQNKKQIAFGNFKINKTKAKGGLVYSNGGSGARPDGLYDAWGKPFYLKLDTEYDGELEDPFKQGNIVRDTIIVYSYGADGKVGGGDDIQTW